MKISFWYWKNLDTNKEVILEIFSCQSQSVLSAGSLTPDYSNNTGQDIRNIYTSRNYLGCSYAKKVCEGREDRAPDGNATTPKAWHWENA